MRQILFKAKRLDNGKWVEGFYVHKTNGGFKGAYILENNTSESIKMGFTDVIHHHVDPETVGQFTGLTDKNGVKIFENDILDCGTYHKISAIKFINGSWKIGGRFSMVGVGSWAKTTTVLGNIFDNPELLKN